jgi:myo-inositol-1(or 4)-monophosphatase
MIKELRVAVATTERAGEILLRRLGRALDIRYKDRINLVTRADHESERAIVRRLRKSFPAYGILAEEGTRIEAPARWIIDPLDGTTNYAHGYPVFCVSIALEREGKIVLGVIYDPTRKEMFTAEEGKGAFLNRKRIHVSKTQDISRAFLVTGFAYDVQTSRDNNLNHFVAMIQKAQAIRRDGSAALNLAYTACGRFDGFWELKLHPWDTAAGSLIVAEAGGRITDFKGRPFSIYGRETLASNVLIHKAMQENLRSRRP